jgi:hypothetical protein
LVKGGRIMGRTYYCIHGKPCGTRWGAKKEEKEKKINKIKYK